MPILPKADIVLTNGRVFRGFSEQVTEAIALFALKRPLRAPDPA